MWKTRCPAIINTRYLSTLASSQPALLTVSPRVLQRQQQQNSKNQRSNQRRQRKGNFIDLIYARSQGGRGGDGSVHFAREPFKDTAPPDGGNGGPGGNVWIEVHDQRVDLRNVQRRYAATEGGKGQSGWGRGKTGEDVVIRVPKGTVVEEVVPAIPPPEWSDAAMNEAISSASQDDGNSKQIPHEPLFIDTSHPLMQSGTRFLACVGGSGGKGNASFLTSTNRSPVEFTEGKPGQIRYLRMELKSIADIGLVGLPNAGKSMFLQSVSRCRTAVGDYAFTTLHPHLGTITFPAQRIVVCDQHASNQSEQPQYDQESTTNVYHVSSEIDKRTKILPPFSFNIADIPGIIRGAAEHDRGLGHAFLRHIERSRLLVYVVDLSLQNPWQDFLTLVNELELHKPGLALNKRGLIIGNKADLTVMNDNSDGQAQMSVKKNYEALVKQLNADDRFNNPKQPWEVIPVSAKYRKNIIKALQKMREIVEESADEEQRGIKQLIDEQVELYGEQVEPLWFNNEYCRGIHEYRLPS